MLLFDTSDGIIDYDGMHASLVMIKIYNTRSVAHFARPLALLYFVRIPCS